MLLKHLSIACVLLGLVVAGTAHAKKYAMVSDSGAQVHIGNGLALPAQTAIPPATPGNQGVFPPLLVKPVPGKVIEGTLNKFTVPAGALSKKAAQKTVGVYFSNPGLYAVATNLSFQWPTAPAVFSVSAGPRGTTGGPTSVIIPGAAAGNSIRYSERVVGKRFGGAGRFALTPGPNSTTQGLGAAPVTLYANDAVFGPFTPPCAACGAIIINAYPTGPGAPGGLPATAIVVTPGAPQPNPQRGLGTFGSAPLGTVIAMGPLTIPIGLNAAAASTGYPWTTGKVTISAMLASPAEKFIISGSDSRTAGGAGAIQMVAGSLSLRNVVGTNANRAWLRLNLRELPALPALTPLMRGVTVALMMALPTVAYAIRSRRRSA